MKTALKIFDQSRSQYEINLIQMIASMALCITINIPSSLEASLALTIG